MLLFERIEAAEPETLEWLERWFIEDLAGQNLDVLIILTHRDSPFTGTGPIGSLTAFRLAPFSTNEIRDHLQSNLGLSPQIAEKRTEEMMSYCGGIPMSIYAGLRTERELSVRRIQA